MKVPICLWCANACFMACQQCFFFALSATFMFDLMNCCFLGVKSACVWSSSNFVSYDLLSTKSFVWTKVQLVYDHSINSIVLPNTDWKTHMMSIWFIELLGWINICESHPMSIGFYPSMYFYNQIDIGTCFWTFWKEYMYMLQWTVSKKFRYVYQYQFGYKNTNSGKVVFSCGY